jgi:hypothetical protein
MTTETASGQYMKNASGHLVPRELVDEIDITRDDMVREIVAKAKQTQEALTAFKTRAMDDIAAFIELSAEKYGVKVGGDKGNVTLFSFDGKYKVVRAHQEFITFDERIGIAKELVDACARRWTEGSRAEIVLMVNQAFQVDKVGRINRNSLLNLTKLKIDDPEWQRAMQAILDSQQVAGSKRYVRIFERVGSSDQYRPIVLDIAAL